MVLELVGFACVGLGVVALVGAGLYLWSLQNRLVDLKNRVDNAWAQIDVQLKRRYDLIPNLVETVKGYMKHEKETLENVTKARAGLQTGSVEDKIQANNMLSQTLKTLFAVAESYPQLKANENFLKLQDELAGTENKIAYIRTAYNDAVMAFNTTIQKFPASIFAALIGFGSKLPYLETPEEERKNVQVKF